ncbi:hypothetical protein IMG5_163610 [Ichthyophthirius multifiliis]|uniref:NadR/Ttd14 AAA domain-containing protein n=1 Tax=Ichthyophthirius multifiliis TaxID=5932 RepID=G0R0D4_ICHMU|nr:hypothetical protein IMG5_163610 [Ichthyophthirius multifiliis]EGR29071.1 hypothetical protein IMG5_163610 [Ichthyophthirius multifiliis]|eukprot:XP_004030307.1 hypothetical protein IMG5_163610 [Ichthyophthirius multifiliis]
MSSSSVAITTQSNQQQDQWKQINIQCEIEKANKKMPSKNKTHSLYNIENITTILPEEIVEQSKHQIIKICLTGGPCAGKTSGLAFLSEKLKDDDFKVYLIPEAATLISTGGGMLEQSNYTDEQIINFQKILMRIQMSLEDQFYQLAEMSGKQSILICDRGLLDGKAFLQQKQWYKILKEMNVSEQEIRDKRYDSVFHLVTAANGASDYYIMDGARFQNKDQAIEIDKKFQKAWMGHQKLEIIDNITVNSFQEKLQKLLYLIRKSSGIPVKGPKLYKRLVIVNPENHPNLPSYLQYESFEIEDIFLYNQEYNENKGKLTKIRKRIQNNEYIYICSENHIINGKQTMYYKKRLNFREYELIKDRQDTKRSTIRKNRRQFVHNGCFYALDKFKEFDMCILRIKNISDNNIANIIPEFLTIDADVTDNKEFRSINLSLKSSPLRNADFLKQVVYQIKEQQK